MALPAAFATFLGIILSLKALKPPVLTYKVISNEERNADRTKDPKILFWNDGQKSVSILDYEFIANNKSFRLTAETYDDNKDNNATRYHIHVPIVLNPGNGIGLYFPFQTAKYKDPITNEVTNLCDLDNIKPYLKIKTTNSETGHDIDLDKYEIDKI